MVGAKIIDKIPQKICMILLRNVDFPSTDSEHLQNHNEEQCRKAWLNDFLCGAVVFLGGAA